MRFDIGWSGVGAVSCAVISLLLIYPGAGDDGTAFLASFPLQIAGLLLLAISLLRHRAWWLLVALPPLLYPLYVWGAILYSCSRGDCL